MEIYKGPKKEPEAIKAILDANNVNVSSVEVEPERGTWKHGRFSVTVQVNGKPFQTFYCMGEGHKRLFRQTVGTPPHTTQSERVGYPSPERDDVLYSLISDAGCFESCLNVDEFASEYQAGQPISATLKAWEDCKRTSEYLTDAFGDDLEAVREAFQDY